MKKYYKFAINLVLASILSIALFILLIFINLPLFLSTLKYPLYLIIFLMVIWLILHELLHGLTYYLTGTKLSNIYFGVAIEKGILYCLSKQEISRRSVLISLITPFILIGLTTLVLSLIINDSMLYFLSILNISGASADLLMFIYFLSIKSEFKYIELDDPTTFMVITNADLNSKRKIGVKIMESGDYSNKRVQIKNYQHITISKFSYGIIVLLFFILILDVIK